MRSWFAVFGAIALTMDGSAQAPRICNMSSLGPTGAGPATMITGFVVGPGDGDTVLVRAVGPGLAPFGVNNFVPDPVLTLSNQAGQTLQTNAGWNSADAATMTDVGAFALTPGSHDCDLVVTLPQGIYTAQVTSSSGDAGQVLLELYEVSPSAASSSLINLSNRVSIPEGGSASNGFIINGSSGVKTLLLRGIGPTLAQYGVTGTMADPELTVGFSTGGAPLGANDDWGTPEGAGAASAAELQDDFATAGAFALPAGSTDSALEIILGPGSYSMTVSGKNGGGGVALVELYDITPANAAPDAVSVTASQPSADTSGSNPGAVTFARVGDLSQPLTVAYAVGGSAVAGIDYPALPGTVSFAAGTASVTVPVTPNPSLNSGTQSTVIVTPAAGTGYAVTGGPATVTITTVPATMYVAKLAAPSGSTASGTATILLAPSGNLATVNISFSGLSSTEVTAHIDIGPPGSNTYADLKVPYGQVSELVWTFAPTANYTTADLIAALQGGQISAEVDSINYPSGELLGQFVASSGSQTFTTPAPPPAIDLSSVSQTDAARFLTQATFGPTQADITTLVNEGYSQWIANQMTATPSSHLTATRADAAAYPNTGNYAIVPANRQEAWWGIAVNGPDQLRQRVALALSEIFVVSDAASSLAEQPEALASYYDLLANDAFGNYRQLLQDVTLSPVMGNYLNMLRNQPANAAKGTSADENYAREVMQLFTIGLNLLNPDGSLQLDAHGLPIATYDQTTVVQTANVLTGWSYASTAANPSFLGGAADWYDPMQLYPAYHDNTAKTIVGGVVLPANEGGTADLAGELDTLFNHQNTAPFFARQLIQHLVTSNPSPGYIYRVAQVFANDGTGVRGNLAAVVQAVLLDYEARSPAMLTDASFGKLKEPLLRETGLYRAFAAASSDGRWGAGALLNPDPTFAEAALTSPTVFNFFAPDYVQPGPLAQAGLYAPEFQITTAATAISTTNFYYSTIYTSATPAASQPVLSLAALTGAADTPAMVATLNLLVADGNLSSSAQTEIINAVNALPASTTAQAKAQYALYLVSTTAWAAVQQ